MRGIPVKNGTFCAAAPGTITVTICGPPIATKTGRITVTTTTVFALPAPFSIIPSGDAMRSRVHGRELVHEPVYLSSHYAKINIFTLPYPGRETGRDGQGLFIE